MPSYSSDFVNNYDFSQSMPLDFGTKEFYHNRKELIESRISWIREADSKVGVVSGWVWSFIVTSTTGAI